MAEERKYEMKKWARSPVVLKKKPFVVRLNKRYIIPDLKIKLQTEERMKKRPKFELIVEQKQKSQKEKVRTFWFSTFLAGFPMRNLAYCTGVS